MNTWGMFSMITRHQYDLLIAAYPKWMAKVWPKIVGRWYLSGPSYNDQYYKRVSFLLSRLGK